MRRRLRSKPLVMDVHTHVGTDPTHYLRGDFPYAQTAESLLVRMDRWGVDVSVCFPSAYTELSGTEILFEGNNAQEPKWAE